MCSYLSGHQAHSWEQFCGTSAVCLQVWSQHRNNLCKGQSRSSTCHCSSGSCLFLLDLSLAFDTVDQFFLLQRLGIKEAALEWIRSYLTVRTQKVTGGSSRSPPVTLTFGVPQRSILGPILLTLYTCPLGPIWKKHCIIYHLYADDQQIYLSFKLAKTGDKDNCIKRLETCIAEIREWMTANILKLNDDEAEFIIFGTKQQLTKIGEVSIAVSSIQVQLVDQVRNLGYYMDQLLKNGALINRLVSNLHLKLKNIQGICSKLDQESTKTIIQANILSRLDCCYSEHQNTSLTNFNKFKIWPAELYEF